MAEYQNHLGGLYTGVATGSQATWTDSYGQGNSFTTVAYYRYKSGEGTSGNEILSEARIRMLNHLNGDTEAGLIVAPTHNLGSFAYGRVTPAQINVQIVKPGLAKITATFAGSESLPTTVSSDTVMIYTAGAFNATTGFPDSRLINDAGGTPQRFDLAAYQNGNALTRAPFTRSIIRWEPTVIQKDGPFGDWLKVGHINASGGFKVPMGRDGDLVEFGAKTVRFDGFSTQYVPGIESGGGVAYRTKYQFSICSTQWVQQAVKVQTEVIADPDNPDNPAEYNSLVDPDSPEGESEESYGTIIYEDQYPSAELPYIYN